MALATNITRRAGSKNYYARITVPHDLKVKLGKSEIWESLRTSEPAEAKRRARPVFDKHDRLFAKLRAQRTLTDYELQTAVWNRYTDLVRADQQRRIELPTEDDLDEIWKVLVAEFGEEQDIRAWRILEEIAKAHDDDKETRSKRLAVLKTEAARGEIRSVYKVVAQVAAARGLDLPPRSPDERKLAHLLQRAEIEALTRAAEYDRGEFGGKIRDSFIKPATAIAPVVAAPVRT